MTTRAVEAALEYAAQGWAVLPLHGPRGAGDTAGCTCSRADCKRIGKHPRTRRGVVNATTETKVIRGWWKRWTEAGIGIATGARSGLVVVDIDARSGGLESLDALTHRHGAMPETVEVLTGGGGRHLYFAHPGGHVGNMVGRLAAGIDVRGDGGYVVAPPSLHVSGRRYLWEVSSLPDAVAVAPMPEWLRQAVVSNRGALDADPDSTCVPADHACPASPAIPESPVTPELDAAIRERMKQTMPTRPGKRRDGLHRLARGLKYNLGLASRPIALFRPYVHEWHDLAFPHTSKTHTRDDSWMDFQEGWTDMVLPLDCSPAELAFEAAKREPPPAIAAQWDDPRVRLLVSICYQCSKRMGAVPFGLSCHQGARLLGMNDKSGPPRVNEWLHRLTKTVPPTLLIVQKGKPGPAGSMATRYRWVGGD